MTRERQTFPMIVTDRRGFQPVVGFESGEVNFYRYARNAVSTVVDPSGLIDVKGKSVTFVHNQGSPSYSINWTVKIDATLPMNAPPTMLGRRAHNTQLWMVTKIETWSVYQDRNGTWQAWPDKGKAQVSYKGDFADIDNRAAIIDRSSTIFDLQRGLQWAIYMQRVTKVVGYNPKGAKEANARNVNLQPEQAEKYIKMMDLATLPGFQYTYLYLHANNRAASGIDIAKTLPNSFERELAHLERQLQRFPQIPQDLSKLTGVLLSAADLSPSLTFTDLTKKK
jgi:hypothetical protein